MSARIEQTVEVIEEVRDNFRNGTGYSSVRQMRINAGHSVASRRGITNQSVISKFITQLKPAIKDAKHFDDLLESWLRADSTELQEIILKYTSGLRDEKIVRNAFYKASEQDILLSEEFGVDPNDIEFKEGKEKLQLHLIKERNRHLVEKAKSIWLGNNEGNVNCTICSFSFSKTYGRIGQGYIEAHHIIPISILAKDTIVKISDLAPICSNCHSIIHRYRPWLTMNQLKNAIEKNVSD